MDLPCHTAEQFRKDREIGRLRSRPIRVQPVQRSKGVFSASSRHVTEFLLVAGNRDVFTPEILRSFAIKSPKDLIPIFSGADPEYAQFAQQIREQIITWYLPHVTMGTANWHYQLYKCADEQHVVHVIVGENQLALERALASSVKDEMIL